MIKKIVLLVICFAAVVLLSSSFYTVKEDEVAVIKTMGKIAAVVVSPGDSELVQANLANNNLQDTVVHDQKGIHIKIPFIQSVEIYTSKYLTYTSLSELVNTSDNRQVEIQMYAQYRILDPAVFNQKVVTKGNANQRMDEDVYPAVINSINKLAFNEFFEQDKLEDMLNEKQETLNARIIKEYGIYVSEIGISRKTFPTNNIATIEEKMTKEIEKESAQSIAEGDSIYNKKVAQVDAQKAEVLAKAIEEAAVIKAEADAEAMRTYQEALQVDLEFYTFIQSMDIYKNMDGSTVFLDQENDILKYLNNPSGQQ